MTRDIVEKEEIEKDLLDGWPQGLNRNQSRGMYWITPEPGPRKSSSTDSTKNWENSDSWYGRIYLSIHGYYFQARGDEVLISDYFAENRVQEIDVD